jgi:hypothetical protein
MHSADGFRFLRAFVRKHRDRREKGGGVQRKELTSSLYLILMATRSRRGDESEALKPYH